MKINDLLKDSAAATPDPERAFTNLKRLLQKSPEMIEGYAQWLGGIARLFSYSQFLADYCIRNPDNLSLALKNISTPLNRQEIVSQSRSELKAFSREPAAFFRKEVVRFLREKKKSHLLRITLRDIMGLAGMEDCMAELSILAEAILEVALDISELMMREKFGYMRDNPFSIMGLGKLGAGELNYSSDVDILTVYHFGERLSTGTLTPYGIRANKIDSHEYFCRLTEILTNLLQTPTEDGIAYRVDLRLRPNGQKGSVSLSLDSYVSYYEAWGKTWERMALIRLRPVAGDTRLGDVFTHVIEPFVWKRSIDYNDVEEIKDLKKKIDAISDVNDIKRGYGGIREIEFFVQTFQLLYGGERKNLRTSTLSKAFEELLKESFLTAEDVKTLSESYLFLRRLEHILQMKEDVQTHSLPSTPDELALLSKKMNFLSVREFLSELKLKRLKVRDMYNSLLGATDETQEALLSLKDELPDDAVRDYLSFKGFRNTESALKNINALIEQISIGKTLRERTLLRKTIPVFLDQIMKSGSKDRALGMLVTFIQKIGNHESYLDLLLQRHDTREIIIRIFSGSTYLARLLLSLENLEGIFEYPDVRIDYKSLQERLINLLGHTGYPLDVIREFKVVETLKSGMLFLKGSLDAYALSHTLSMLADIIIRSIIHYLRADRDFAVIGLGGFGARDLNIGSDLDLLFISAQKKVHTPRTISDKRKGSAEELIRFLSEYTSKGFAYKVDMRLRPDGSRGVLVNNIEGYMHYYLKAAKPWEIQSLLRARPVAGDANLLKAFQQLKRQIVVKRGHEISGSDMKEMRKRIVREVSKESSGYDIKTGPGGIKEIEFLTQYLQLKHVADFSNLVVPGTVPAIQRLTGYGILDRASGEILSGLHRYLRTIDTLLRLNEEDVLRTDSGLLDIIVIFLHLKSKDELIRKVEDTRREVVEIAERFYEKEP